MSRFGLRHFVATADFLAKRTLHPHNLTKSAKLVSGVFPWKEGHMRRREFIAGTAATAAMGFAQPIWAETNARSTGVKRLAIFYPGEIDETGARKAYFAELKRLGYIEGQNLIVERYAALGQFDRFGDLARQIIASRPDVILSLTATVTKEVMAVTTSIPMVAPTPDPVAWGFSTSLARPDRNFTGVVVDAGLELWQKRVQLLLETARKATKLGLLIANPNPTPVPPDPFDGLRAGIATAIVVVAGKIDRAAFERVYDTVIVGGEKVDRTAFEKTFEAMEKEGVDGLIVSDTAEFATYRQLIIDLAARFRVPAIYPYRESVEVGGLMSYGVDRADLWRRVAGVTVQVLGGTKVSDIPFYRLTKFDLVLNQKTATSLGLEFAPALLLAADEVID
jgi:putative ABC transport system substrate-binding protein